MCANINTSKVRGNNTRGILPEFKYSKSVEQFLHREVSEVHRMKTEVEEDASRQRLVDLPVPEVTTSFRGSLRSSNNATDGRYRRELRNPRERGRRRDVYSF